MKFEFLIYYISTESTVYKMFVLVFVLLLWLNPARAIIVCEICATLVLSTFLSYITEF